jgi:hypothetical protein
MYVTSQLTLSFLNNINISLVQVLTVQKNVPSYTPLSGRSHFSPQGKWNEKKRVCTYFSEAKKIISDHAVYIVQL